MQLLNIKETAEVLRTSPVTIRRIVKSETIPYRRLGTDGKNTRIFFTPEDLSAYLEAAAVPVRAPAKEAQGGYHGQIPTAAITTLEGEVAGLVHGTATLTVHIRDRKLA